MEVYDSESTAIEVTRSPTEIVAGATEQATVLMEIVESQRLYTMISGKKYLQAEAWEVILAFNNVAPSVVWTKDILDNDGVVEAVEVKVDLISKVTGAHEGSGIMRCGMDSFPTRGKQGQDKYRAAMSAAQTWALSKAARMSYSWVAVMAKFQPTPAEEMYGNQDSDNSDQGYGFCAIEGHDNEPFFMRGNMSGPAHKDNNDKWCNKPGGNEPKMAGSPKTATQVLQERVFNEFSMTHQREVWPLIEAALGITSDEAATWWKFVGGDSQSEKMSSVVTLVGQHIEMQAQDATDAPREQQSMDTHDTAERRQEKQRQMNVGPAADIG
jgi:hypothetical protein